MSAASPVSVMPALPVLPTVPPPLLPGTLTHTGLGRVAFVMSNAIGDSLVSMVIVRNLLDNHIPVTVFGGPAYALRHWFARVEIHPLPQADEVSAVLAEYDTVIQMQYNQPIADLLVQHPRVVTLHDVEFGARSGCMAERFAEFCRVDLGLPDVTMDNGITAPRGLRHRRYLKRVVIHPEASTEDKRWSSRQFVRLAQRLQALGFEVYFVIAPHELARWTDLDLHKISAPHFDNLNQLASWVYESGWFIGNDSGIGHLASNLGIPGISLFRRRGVAQRWRPAWGNVKVVLCWQWLPTAYLKERFWRQALTCRRVLGEFLELVEQDKTRFRGSRFRL